MAADKHRIPGDADKHLSDWRFDDAEGGSFTTESLGIGGGDPITWSGNLENTSRYLWAIGGYVNNSKSITDEVSVYDLVRGEWLTVDSRVPTAISNGGVAEYDGQLIVFGGETRSGATDAVQIYDIASNEWSTEAPIPTARNRLGHTVPVYEGKAYVFGGYDGSSRLNTLEVYDIEDDSWDTSVPDAPSTHSFPEPAVYNDKIWYLTGTTRGGSVGAGGIQRYDPATGTWMGPDSFANHPAGATDGGGAFYRGKWHAVGGWNNSGGTRDGVPSGESMAKHYSYDFNSDSWTQVSTYPDRWSHGAVMTDGVWLIVYQGRYDYEVGNQDAMNFTGDIYRWHPVVDDWEYLGTSRTNKWNIGPAVSATAATEQPNGASLETKVVQGGGVDQVAGRAAEIETRGLTGYWPISAGSGSTIYDESEAGNDGAASNIAWGTNSALSKDEITFGGNGYVDLGNLSAFQPENFDGGFTIMVEATPTSTDLDGNRHYILGKVPSSGNTSYAVRFNPQIKAEVHDGSSFLSPSTKPLAGSFSPTAGNVYRIYLWHDRNELRLFVNGEYVNTVVSDGQASSGGGSALTLGDRSLSNGQNLDGTVSAFALWREPLPTSRIAAIDRVREFATEEDVQ